MKIKLKGTFPAWQLILLILLTCIANILIAMGIGWIIEWATEAIFNIDVPYWPVVALVLIARWLMF